MMLKIAAFALCLAPVLAHAQEAPLHGSYTVHIDIAGNEHDFACNFDQKEKVLTGTCSELSDFSGSVDGVNVTFKAKGDQTGMAFTGKLGKDGVISGTVNAVDYNVEGEFKATPAAKPSGS